MNKLFKYSVLIIALVFFSLLLILSPKGVNAYIPGNSLISSVDFKYSEGNIFMPSNFPYVNKKSIEITGKYTESNLIKISVNYYDYNSENPNVIVNECIRNLTDNDNWTCNIEFKKSGIRYNISIYDIENNKNDFIGGLEVIFDNEPYSGYTLNSDYFREEILENGSFNLTLDISINFEHPQSHLIPGFVRGYYKGIEVCKGSGSLYRKYADNRADNEMRSSCKFRDLDIFCVNYPYLDMTVDDGFGNLLPTTRVYFPSYTNPLNTPLCKYPPQKDALYRFWSDKNKSHFYTSSLSERNSVIDWRSDEWKYEGVAYTTPSCSIEGVSTVYRFWSNLNKKHFYTNSLEERNHVINAYDDNEWLYEGEAFCAYTSGGADKMPVYRFWSDMYKGHFYTSSEEEKNEIMRIYSTNEWKLEGVAYYVSR